MDRRVALRLFAVFLATGLVSSVITFGAGLGPVFLVLSWFAWAAVAIASLAFSAWDVLGVRGDRGARART